VAKRAEGMDVKVTVVEVDPIKAIEAHLDGFEVTNIMDAARRGEIFISATGQKNVVPYAAIEKMNDGAILSNAGHFDVEIDVKTLLSNAKSVKEVRPHVDGVTLPNGKRVVVVGYGWVGKGVAKRARGMDAKVTVVEVDPIKAIEAYLDGFEVTNIMDAARRGEIFITATGQKNVVPYAAIEKMNDGAILSNAGHFDVEIDVKTLLSKAKSVKEVRPHVDEVTLPNGKRVHLIGKGRITNLVAAEGHPPEVMQMSFANQLLAAIYIRKNHSKMEKKIYGVPEEMEREIAYATLDSLGIVISEPTEEQAEYAQSWAI